MGQKVSPNGFRVGIISDWNSKWYADKKNFANYLVEDNQIREYVKRKLYAAGISKIVIERAADNQIKVSVMTDKPGIIIGRDGSGVDVIRKALEQMTGKTVRLNIIEVKRAELDATLTAESIAQALEKRISFRRAMKQAIGRTMRANAKGIKVVVAGRLGGAEIARSEKYNEGNVPLHTLRAIIDYGVAEADTQYGKIGIKVWINQGERLEKGLMSPIPEERPGQDRGDRGDRRGPRRDRDRDRDRGDREGGDRPRRDRRDGPGGRGPGGPGGGPGGRGRGRGQDPEVPRAINPRKRPPAPKKEREPAPPPVEETPVAVEEPVVEAVETLETQGEV
ncbi:MAG: 30S ribosomal protein S3 [Clostridiales bacterium]|nr:30S ribosomal protein S3 [Clostridiales bacterium]